MAPDKIGRYEIERELGRGGMAVVYLAHDPFVERQVAVKVLPREFTFNPKFRTRFQREAKIIAILEHSYIVPIYDFGEDDKQPYIVMRYMSGGSLEDRINEGLFSLAAASKILQRIGAALDAAHRQRIIHRDLKPGNILFDAQDQAFLSDFGVAKIVEDSPLTGTGGIIGTPAYMSPEQIDGGTELDGRSDIYALGVILFEMLTGQVPYKGDTPARQMMKHVLEPVPYILKVKPDLPSDCETIIAQALAKNQKDRFATAGELATALGLISREEAKPPKSETVKTSPQTPLPDASNIASEEAIPTPPEVQLSTQEPLPRLSFEPEMILIPAGEFLMGSDPQEYNYVPESQQPQHTLYLPNYYMAKTPITNAQYAAFIRATGHQPPKYWKSKTPETLLSKVLGVRNRELPENKEDHPVVGISWHDAMAYCRWLTKTTGKAYHLPSEAEWEKGARGTDGRTYPWGNQWNVEQCNSREAGKEDTSPVDAYPTGASPYGLLDMAGNIWEWTRSLWGKKEDEPDFNYPYDPSDGRENLEKGAGFRVLRGGAFNLTERAARCTSRVGGSLELSDSIGFRVVVKIVDHEQAIADYNTAIELDPKNVRAYNNRGIAYANQGNYEQAIADYNTAIELDPKNVRAYNDRGIAYANQRNYQKAIADYNKAIELDPNSSLAHNNLAWTLAHDLDMNYEDALAHAQRAVELDQHAYYHDTLALVHYKLKQYDEALEHYSQALFIRPNYISAYRSRGDVYIALDEIEAALEEYRTYISLAPEGPKRDAIKEKIKTLQEH